MNILNNTNIKNQSAQQPHISPRKISTWLTTITRLFPALKMTSSCNCELDLNCSN